MKKVLKAMVQKARKSGVTLKQLQQWLDEAWDESGKDGKPTSDEAQHS